ncbi:hypothetical protein B7494_g4126 [Chlorociboria aeruginascens]|nr:hypothetical protein B7494_g4126 [Chlorociboria aeruginascens]
MPRTPTALPPALPTELLSWILTLQSYPRTLIICKPRTLFLSSLISFIQASSPQDPDQDLPSSPSLNEESPQQQRHPLLIPTLHQIAISRHINLVFIPTVSHLRAYLSVFPPIPEPPPTGERESQRQGMNGPLVVIFGLVELHRDTSEWSAQGLGSSLAGLVDAGYRAGRRIVLLEERGGEEDGGLGVVEEKIGNEEGDGDEDQDEDKRLWKGWEEKVPMLNGTVRRIGLENEDDGYSGRTVEIGRVIGRWFTLVPGCWESDDLELTGL